MATNPYAPPASEEEQFREVSRLLGVALGRWLKLNRVKILTAGPPADTTPPAQHVCERANDAVP